MSGRAVRCGEGMSAPGRGRHLCRGPEVGKGRGLGKRDVFGGAAGGARVVVLARDEA